MAGSISSPFVGQASATQSFWSSRSMLRRSSGRSSRTWSSPPMRLNRQGCGGDLGVSAMGIPSWTGILHVHGRGGNARIGTGTTNPRHPEHRDHGPHRRGEDHALRAFPLRGRSHPQDGGGPRRAGRDGLDGSGAGARDHHHLGGEHLRVVRPGDPPHRYPGPRGLHGGGGAEPARPRRRGGGLRRGQRRRAAERDRLAAGRPLPCPAHRARQQDGPGRRRLRGDAALHAEPLPRPPDRRGAPPPGRGGRLHGARGFW